MRILGKEIEGIGISWLWKLSDSHPFYFAGVTHDRAYDFKIHKTSYQADQIFLEECLSVADTWSLKSQAYLFYALARAWGAVRWKQKNSKSLFI